MPLRDHGLPSDPGRSPMLPRNVITTRPELEQRLLATLDGIDEPISIGTAIRDRDGRIGGLYDLRAVRLGDGYLSTWRLQAATPQPG